MVLTTPNFIKKPRISFSQFSTHAQNIFFVDLLFVGPKQKEFSQFWSIG